MQFPPRLSRSVDPLPRSNPAQPRQRSVPLAAPQKPSAHRDAFSLLPQRRSRGTQATPSTSDAATQVSDRHFENPARAAEPAAANRPPAPIYHRIDHTALAQTKGFWQEILNARATYGSKVRFTKLKDGERTIGFVLSARRPLAAAKASAGPERQRALYVAGSSSPSPRKTTFSTSANIFATAGNPATPTALATELRREKTQLAQGTSYFGENTVVPNYYVGSDTLKAQDAARYVSNAGRSSTHTQQVDVFVAAPGQQVHLSTVMRALPPDAYGGVIYGMH